MLNVGQEVRVFDVNGKRAGMPEDGWPGEVVKVGRVLATIRYRRHEETFRLDTGRANDRYGHQWFLTLAQATDKQDKDEAVRVLRAHRVEAGQSTLSTAQLMAMAEIARDGVE